MTTKNYIELPAEGLVRGSMIDEGNAVTVYLDVHEEERPASTGDPEQSVTATERVKGAMRCAASSLSQKTVP